ncbi:hypothetical protein BJV78DRAFT_1199189 [Lactifluus subvellereus]|nr:hypothetical protein BJV78DRAFT_1199189 [Lactifluus subvellereus]
MDPSRRDTLSYAASCNPPRRAKRPSSAGTPLTATDRAVQPLPALAPAINTLSPDGMKPADDEDDFAVDVPQPKRRGRKPSSLSRAARESMRRQNHSRIEKARRTKINEALSMLRDLVPPDAGRKHATSGDESIDDDDEDDEIASGKKPAKVGQQKQEKEFKLEILEKAVVYVQELQEKVRVFETQGCPRCSNVNTPSTYRPKRKREAMPPSDDYDSPSSVDVATERPIKRFTPTQSIPPPLPAASSTRLPSISSWLPKAVAESGLPESRTPPSVNLMQLPTPPASGVIAPIASPQVPPALRLELPLASLSVRNATASSSSSPSWTPEDESIASLLLRIKTSSSPKAAKHSSSVHDLLAPTPGAPGIGGSPQFSGVDEMRVQTPGSLLGLTTDGQK